MDHSALWQAARDELRLQTTEETFQWIRPLEVLPSENGTLRLGAPDARSLEWLEHRLRPVIERTVGALAEGSVAVVFALRQAQGDLRQAQGESEDRPQGEGLEGLPEWARRLISSLAEERDEALRRAEDVRSRLERLDPAATAPRVARATVDFEARKAGYVPMPGYCQAFWAPLLRRVAWRVWELVLRADRRKKKTTWTPPTRFSAPKLAASVPCGRQAVVGVWRKCNEDHAEARLQDDGVYRRWQRGAFDRLRENGLATVEVQGSWRHRTYLISVRTTWPVFPLLRPAQVARLKPDLQEKHARWLRSHGFDPREWDV